MKPFSPRSDFSPAPFDGRRFANLGTGQPHGLGAVLRWMLTRQRGAWPSEVANDPAPRPRARVDDGTIHATVIGHATVLIQVAGLNLLPDPVWSPTIGPVKGLGIRRVCPPALAFEDLPKIDVVLLSHNHYDHLDRPTLAALAARDRPLVLTGLKGGKAVPGETVELDWWQSHDLSDRLRATYVPATHFSGRGLFDRNASLWGGFVVESPSGPIYFAGDTGAGPHFAQIRERFGPITLALLPIGAYAPRWFMAAVHVDPAEAVAASLTLEAKCSLAIHFGTFRLADEPFDAPPQALAEALAAARGPNRGLDFRIPRFGSAEIVEAGTQR